MYVLAIWAAVLLAIVSLGAVLWHLGRDRRRGPVAEQPYVWQDDPVPGKYLAPEKPWREPPGGWLVVNPYDREEEPK